MKIEIDQIECQSGYATIQKNGPLFAWAGEVKFSQSIKIIGVQGVIPAETTYHGPLNGCGINLDEVFGNILITECKRTDRNLITGVSFVGNGLPFLPLSIEIEQKEKIEMYFVIQPSDGGTLEVYETKTELNRMLSKYPGEPIFLDDVESDAIYLEDWRSKSMYIIKGKTIVPKPARVIQEYEVE